MADNSSSKPRRSERQPIRMAVVLLTDSEEGETRSEVSTLDVSQHGCRVEGVAHLSHGQLVRIIPSESSETAMIGRVIWVGEPASDLAGEAGIEFLQLLPPTV